MFEGMYVYVQGVNLKSVHDRKRKDGLKGV